MPKKRSNGEGSIHKRPNGIWELQTMIGYQPDGRRKMKSFYGKTQKEVREKAKAYLEEHPPHSKLNGDMKFKEWSELWYESMKGQISETTYENYRYTLRHLQDYFGDMRLSDIKAMTIEEFLKQSVAEGRSKSFVTKYRGMMFQVMKAA